MKVLIAVVTIITLGLIALINFVSVPGITDVPLAREAELFAGEGELCSTFSYNISCQKGLVCLTEDGNPVSNIKKETAYCTDPNK